MGFRHSGIFNNNELSAHQKDFPSSDDIGNGAIFTCACLSFALMWHKTSFLVFDSHSRDSSGHHISDDQSVLLVFRSVKVLNLFIINYFEENSANAISSQYDVPYMKIVASETSVQNISESLKHKRELVHDEFSRKKKRQNLSKSNSDEAVLSFSMKRTDGKAENVFKERNSVSLTKSSDNDKRRLHEYYLHNKEIIRQRHKDYCNNNKKRIRGNSKNNRKKQKISSKNPQGRAKKFLHLAKRGPTFICVVCNRCLYARSVMEFQFNKYNLDLTGIIHKVTKNDTTYICNTCHSYLKKSHIAAQAVCNKLQIFKAPAANKT